MITIQMTDRTKTNRGVQMDFDLSDDARGCNATVHGDIWLSHEQTLEPQQDQVAYRWLAETLEAFATHVRKEHLD